MDIVGAGMPALQEAIDAMPVTDHLTFRLPQAKGSRWSSASTRLSWLGWMTG